MPDTKAAPKYRIIVYETQEAALAQEGRGSGTHLPGRIPWQAGVCGSVHHYGRFRDAAGIAYEP